MPTSGQPKQIAEEQDVSSLFEVAAERLEGPRPLEAYSTSMNTPAHVVERMDDRDPRPPAGTSVPNPGGGFQVVDSVAMKQSEIVESSPSIQDSVDPRPKTTPPTADIFPLHCRMCDAPPTLTTQPTVTTCGHLFCFG